MAIYSGFLLGLSNSDVPHDMSFGVEGGALPFMKKKGTFFGIPNFARYQLTTERELLDAPTRSQVRRNAFDYDVLIASGFRKVLLLSESKDVSNYLKNEAFVNAFSPKFREIDFKLDSLIDSCEKIDSRYIITILHGRYSLADDSLKRASFYGSDLTEAGLIKQYRKRFNFFSCGVQKRTQDGLPLISGREGESQIALVGNDGFISASLSNRSRATDLLQLLDFIVKNRWVSNWVATSEKEGEI